MTPDHQTSPTFYLCTGFHRSGTSLLAQSMANGGVHMGDELMGASFSNPLGHVEDMPIVRLHDKIFEINGTDWRYADNAPLVKPNWLSNYIEKYIDEKRDAHDLVGVKDPRAVFFLKDWQVAGKQAMRYVFVYRHWSTAVNSILNRASRHLVNSTAAISANKLNFSFFQQVELAFNMWKASNDRILGFYQAHPDKCLLISQDALIDDNQGVCQRAGKIGLPPQAFSLEHYDPALLTNQVPENVCQMASTELQQSLDDSWQALQMAADAPASRLPERVAVGWYPQREALGIVVDCPADVTCPEFSFNLSGLSWEEACGFLVRIPQKRAFSSVFTPLLSRPFTGVANYEALARIAHRNQRYLITKLCKFRAMQVRQGDWDIPGWTLYTESSPRDWQTRPDASLPQGNPFSLRPREDLAELADETDISWLDLAWPGLLARLESLSGQEVAECLELTLLYRSIENADQLRALAAIARQHQYWYLAEFALIKAIRRQSSAGILLELGDVYRSCQLLEPALGCFTRADAMQPDVGPQLARIADVKLASGDVQGASVYLDKAKVLSPHNRVVKRCQQKLQQANEAKAQVADDAASGPRPHTMASVCHYQEIVELQRVDPQAGQALDLHNRKMSFILRDNRDWLKRGVELLSPQAGECLAHKIYHNWCKIFTPEIVQNAVKIEQPEKFSHLVSSPAGKIAPVRFAYLIDVTSLNTWCALMSVISRQGWQADLLLTCPGNLAHAVRALAAEYHNGQVFVEQFDARPIGASGWFNVHQSVMPNYDVLCRLHTDERQTLPNVKGEYLQQVYAMLEQPQGIENVLAAFARDEKLGLVVPPLHPLLAEHELSEHMHSVITRYASELGLSGPTDDYCYPAGRMCYFRPAVFTPELASVATQILPAHLHRLLPLLAQSRGYKYCCSQAF